LIAQDQRCRLAIKGLGLSAGIVLGWLVSLVGCLSLDSSRQPWWLLVVLILVRTQLQTGLFIVGHDAMHRLLWPADRARNDALGALVLLLYAALPYSSCHACHRRHHRNPGSFDDPDCPEGRTAGLLSWYQTFMASYLSRRQMASLLAAWAVLADLFSRVTPTAPVNVLLFCTLPLLLSSWQLFTVGTYLPHRSQWGASGDGEPASLDLPPWLSLLACFHFGYHREHHDNPDLPWFALPAVRRRPVSLALSWKPR